MPFGGTSMVHWQCYYVLLNQIHLKCTHSFTHVHDDKISIKRFWFGVGFDSSYQQQQEQCSKQYRKNLPAGTHTHAIHAAHFLNLQ